MRTFCFVAMALLALVASVPQAQACNGVVAVQAFVQPVVVPVFGSFGFVQPVQAVVPVFTSEGLVLPVQAVTVVQPFVAVQAVQVQRVVAVRQNVVAVRGSVTEVRTVRGPLGLFERTVIRQR